MKAWNGGEVDAEDTVTFGTCVEAGFVALGRAVGGSRRSQRLGLEVGAGIQFGELGLDMLVAGGDLMLVMEPSVVGLAEGEEMFWEPVAVETASDDIFGSFDVGIFEGGQGEGIALAGEDGLQDGLAGDAGEIADDVVELNIHLGERLVEEADLVGGTTEEAVAMAQNGADGTNGFGRAKAAA